MISTISKRIINDERGAVDLIESSLILPILLSLITALFIISFSLIINVLVFETTYWNIRQNLNEDSGQFLFLDKIDDDKLMQVESKLNSKIASLNGNPIDLSSSAGLISKKIQVKNEDSKVKMQSSKVKNSDYIRKIDFVAFFLEENSEKILENDTLQKMLNTTKDLSKGLLGN